MIRTAPWTLPPDATGTATYNRSVPRVSEARVPLRALAVEGGDDLRAGREVARRAAGGVGVGDAHAGGVDDDDAPAGVAVVGQCRVDGRGGAGLEVVLDEGCDRLGVAFDVEGQPVCSRSAKTRPSGTTTTARVRAVIVR